MASTGTARIALDAPTEAGVVASLALRAADTAQVTPGKLYLASDANGEQRVVSTLGYAGSTAGRPPRKTGSVEVHDSDAFAWLIAKHGLDETEIYADVRSQKVVAVLNAHGGGSPIKTEGTYALRTATADSVDDPSEEFPEPNGDDLLAGWGDHRITLQLHKTPAWKAWELIDRQLLPQEAFAEHVEERLVDFKEPSGAEMLEVAQTFQATRGAAFESSHRLADGQVQLGYREETKATAGKNGALKIPELLSLVLVPFEGGGAYAVEARFRYRLTQGRLHVGAVLTRPEDILRAAFLDEVLAIHQKTGRQVLNGVPASTRTGASVRG